jgi:hypothetical protein
MYEFSTFLPLGLFRNNHNIYISLNNIMNTDITEQYLNKVYEDLVKEQMKLMADMKSGGNELQKEKDITKQITLINTLTLGVMRLRNLRKQIADKINL